MKLRCLCGFVIYDQTDYLPYKSYVLPDQEYHDRFEHIANARAPRQRARRVPGTRWTPTEHVDRAEDPPVRSSPSASSARHGHRDCE
jgi:hypothetical protein